MTKHWPGLAATGAAAGAACFFIAEMTARGAWLSGTSWFEWVMSHRHRRPLTVLIDLAIVLNLERSSCLALPKTWLLP